MHVFLIMTSINLTLHGIIVSAKFLMPVGTMPVSLLLHQRKMIFIIRLRSTNIVLSRLQIAFVCMRPRDCFLSIMFFQGMSATYILTIKRAVWACSDSVFWFWFYCFSFTFSSVVYIFHYTAVFLVFMLPSGIIKNDNTNKLLQSKYLDKQVYQRRYDSRRSSQPKLH